MTALFHKRIEVYKEAGDPTAAKAVSFVQQFLLGAKKGGLEASLFERSGISVKEAMDPLFLDMALLKDPDEYLAEERRRLNTHRIHFLQMASLEIEKKIPGLTRCTEIAGRAASLTADEVSQWIQELRSHKAAERFIPHLEGLAALMNTDEAIVNAELLTHYMASLQIQEKVMMQRLPKNELSRGEVRALEILTQRLSGAAEGLDPIEGKRMQRFLQEICGNLEFNERLMKYAKARHLTISKQALDFASEFSYKFTKIGDYRCVMNRVRNLEGKLAQGQATTVEDRLSLKEMRTVESVARLQEKFAAMAAIGIPVHHPLVDLAMRADVFVQHVLRTAEFQTPHKGASCIYYDVKNADDYYTNWSGGPIRRFIYNHLIPWPLLHTALAVPHNGQNWTSHIHNNHHILHRRPIGDYAFKTFEIDFSKIVTQEGKVVLERIFGPNWEAEVERIYTNIAHDIHTNKEALAPIRNPAIRRVLAAVNIGYGIFDNHALEHRPLNNQQICSAFVLNTSLEAFTRLEERLKERCNADMIPAGFRFVQLPIHKRRLLDFVTPHQLARRSLPISREVPKPQVIRQVLNFHEFEMK